MSSSMIQLISIGFRCREAWKRRSRTFLYYIAAFTLVLSVMLAPSANASGCDYSGTYSYSFSITNTWNGTCYTIGTRAQYMSDWVGIWTAWSYKTVNYNHGSVRAYVPSPPVISSMSYGSA